MEIVKKFYDLEELRTEVFEGKISKAHIYNLVKKGKIPSICLGRRLLVPHSYVQSLFRIADK